MRSPLATTDFCGPCTTSCSINKNGIPRFQIVQQFLQVRLFHLATDQQGDEAVLRLRPGQVHLRRLHGAAELRDGARDPLQKRRAGNGYRLATEERRAGGNRPGRIVRGIRILLARLELIENIGRIRKNGALLKMPASDIQIAAINAATSTT